MYGSLCKKALLKPFFAVAVALFNLSFGSGLDEFHLSWKLSVSFLAEVEAVQQLQSLVLQNE